MANKYKAGKFNSPFGKANIESDSSKAQAALGDDYESELKNFQDAVGYLTGRLDKIQNQLQKLRDHKDTGKDARTACQNGIDSLKKIKNNLKSAFNKMEKAIDAEEKAEYKRMIAWYRQSTAAETALGQNTEI